MEFNKVVEARQSVRRYVPCEISEEELAEMVRAAVISIGKPAPNPKSPKKKPIEEIFTMIG